MVAPLLTLTDAGLYCPRADVYVDPWKPVKRALVSHAHSDHARPGSSYYLAHRQSVPVLHLRLGTTPDQIQGVDYGEKIAIQGVNFSFHPAGHVPGSAQILVEADGERWVFSGDYKLEDDRVSTPFEPIRCNTFISECTFGLPIFSWRPQHQVFEEIHSWWKANREAHVTSVICAYSLGKAQRVLASLDRSIGPVCIHSSIMRVCQALNFQLHGILGDQDAIRASEFPLVLVPPAMQGSRWLNRFGAYRVAHVSGWMAIRGMKRRRGVERGFILSDHADFRGLTSVIAETSAESIHLTHGYTAPFARWLSEVNPALQVRELEAQYLEEPTDDEV